VIATASSRGFWPWPALTLPHIPDRRSLRIGSETTQADVEAVPDGRSPRVAARFSVAYQRRPQFPAGSSGCACPSSRPRLGRPHAEPCSGGVAGRPVPGSRACLTNGTRKQQSGRRKQTGGRRRQHIRPPKSRRASHRRCGRCRGEGRSAPDHRTGCRGNDVGRRDDRVPG